MASAVWSAIEGNAASMSSAAANADPAAMLNSQLASALSLTGDAQYWEESISPATIRQSLSEADPSNPASTQSLLRGMKWLLASISKGRNVSDFYPHVVKLVGATSLEVRKMVYMYLVQYANYDPTTRELSLLSINSFQRGLADSEQLIRALALRVLTSIRIADIVQIQILGIQKCATDRSPYVRKCAANALCKLHGRSDSLQKEVLLQILADFLAYDDATMVLTAACIALTELCPDRLDLLHPAFGKICHLLTDMDEWGQVIVIDLLARYCRTYFAEPGGWREGSAERIDRERRVRRTIQGIAVETTNKRSSKKKESQDSSPNASLLPSKAMEAAAQNVTLPPRTSVPHKIKRRVVRKGFYSDEEDESTEEEVFAETLTGPALSVSAALRDTKLQGDGTDGPPVVGGTEWYDAEAADLHPDHRTILKSALSLLKSRNAGVVLAVCSLHYYCGVSSVAVRAALGKALVRIHRDQREIQYVVLASIRTLVTECPSAFSPFLHDFYVKALDPPFTRLIKLDILTSLALDPMSIKAVLEELRSYVRHGDREFACAAVRAVGRVVELARIVHDRHGQAQGRVAEERRQANTVALNALAGLLTLTQTSERSVLVGQAVIVMQQILALLKDDGQLVEDPLNVQDRVRNRVLLLEVYTLSKRLPIESEMENNKEDDSDDEDSPLMDRLGQLVSVVLPPPASASAIWLLGESLASTQTQWNGRIRAEFLRLLARCFPDLDGSEKEQAIHMASKVLVSSVVDSSTAPICEQLLSMGRMDVVPDVRDRARFESHLIEASNTVLQHDRENLEALPASASLNKPNAIQILLSTKPQPSSLPLEKSNSHATESDAFRFGTLSSLVGHRARSAYIALPPWATEDSSSDLRKPKKREVGTGTGGYANGSTPTELPSGRFYDEESSGSTSDSSSSSSSSSDSSSESSDSESESDRSNKASSTPAALDVFASSTAPAPVALTRVGNVETASDSSASSSSGDDDDDDDDDDGYSSSSEDSSSERDSSHVATGNLVNMGDSSEQPPVVDMFGSSSLSRATSQGGSSAADDLKGLVMAPIVVDQDAKPKDPNFDRDSGSWTQIVRPEHSGGLSVQIRVLRGVTKARQAQLMNLPDASPKVVCIQFRFSNTKDDNTLIRRIRILQKSSSASASTIAPRKVVVPPEIEQLGPGQKSDCVVGIEFASASDRDGSLQAKFDIKFGSGATPVDIRPTLGDVLLPCKIKQSDFDQEISRLQGFQRVETNISASWDGLAQSIMDAAALSKVKSDDSNHLRFVATLPASSDTIFISLRQGSTAHKMVICSDNALAANSLVNVLKRFLS